jgi:hypothetical protein
MKKIFRKYLDEMKRQNEKHKKERLIRRIEAALEIRLYTTQIDYILYEDKRIFGYGRCTGRTTAYCIKLALSGEKIDLRKQLDWSLYIDEHHEGMYTRLFWERFIDIWKRLKAAGLPVCEVRPGRNIKL